MCDYRNDGIVCMWRFLRTTSAVIERIGEPEEERHILTGLRYKYQRLDFFSFVMPFFNVVVSYDVFTATITMWPLFVHSMRPYGRHKRRKRVIC